MQMLIFALIGLCGLGLLVYLFSFLGKQEQDSDPKRAEEQWVRSHGDAAMVKMYYKAHSDEERAQIVSFIRSSCEQPPSPEEAPGPGRQPLFFGGPAPLESTAEIRRQQAEAQLFADPDDEEEAEALPLSRKERKALRQQEKAEKAAAKAAAKEAALAAALAEANKVRVSQGDSGEQQEYADLESALHAAISQVDTEAAQQLPPQPEAVPSQQTGNLCPACGAETLPSCQFCIICGQPLGQPTAEQAQSFPSESPASSQAQPEAELREICPICGAAIPANNPFCIICGQPLRQPEAIEIPAPVIETAEQAPEITEVPAPVIETAEQAPEIIEAPAPVIETAEQAPEITEAPAPVIETAEQAPEITEAPAPVIETVEQAPVFQSFNLFQALNSDAEAEQPEESIATPEAASAEAPAEVAIEAPAEAPVEVKLEEIKAERQNQAYREMKNEFRSMEDGISASAAALSAEIEAMRAHMDSWQFSERASEPIAPPPKKAEAPAPERREAAPSAASPASKDYSATLGLSGALSLEEILRNVQELEKRISKGSEFNDEE
ncbi:MAG: zinc ribbon domain-containing protein [Firmicutes bacterium]|nr:zinc ribbon domain-containing protein [Bacillota bacterium]